MQSPFSNTSTACSFTVKITINIYSLFPSSYGSFLCLLDFGMKESLVIMRFQYSLAFFFFFWSYFLLKEITGSKSSLLY